MKDEVKGVDDPKIFEDLNEPKVKTLKDKLKDLLWKALYIFLMIPSIAVLIVIIKYMILNPGENTKILVYFIISLVVNCLIIFLFFIKGGKEILARLRNKRQYQTGDYVNIIHIMNSGNIKERFINIDKRTQSFKMNEKPYALNPNCLYTYKDMKTYIYVDGYPAPIKVNPENIIEELSNDEMDRVMTAATNFDLLAWIEKHKLLAIIIAGAIIVGLSIIGYQVFQNGTMLKKGTYNADNIINAVKVLCTTGNQTASNVIQQVSVV